MHQAAKGSLKEVRHEVIDLGVQASSAAASVQDAPQVRGVG